MTRPSQDIVVALVDDPDRSVRFRAWGAVRELKLKKAVPRAQGTRSAWRPSDSAALASECSRRRSKH